MMFPTKMLIVKDLTFILPPDFTGDLSDALRAYIEYRSKHQKNSKKVNDGNTLSTTEVVLTDKENALSCILYGIVEIDEEGKYTVIESSSSDVKV